MINCRAYSQYYQSATNTVQKVGFFFDLKQKCHAKRRTGESHPHIISHMHLVSYTAHWHSGPHMGKPNSQAEDIFVRYMHTSTCLCTHSTAGRKRKKSPLVPALLSCTRTLLQQPSVTYFFSYPSYFLLLHILVHLSCAISPLFSFAFSYLLTAPTSNPTYLPTVHFFFQLKRHSILVGLTKEREWVWFSLFQCCEKGSIKVTIFSGIKSEGKLTLELQLGWRLQLILRKHKHKSSSNNPLLPHTTPS